MVGGNSELAELRGAYGPQIEPRAVASVVGECPGDVSEVLGHLGPTWYAFNRCTVRRSRARARVLEVGEGARETPEASPRHPACATLTRVDTSSQSTTGTQSATRTAIARSDRGRHDVRLGLGVACSAMATALEWT